MIYCDSINITRFIYECNSQEKISSKNRYFKRVRFFVEIIDED